MSTESHRSSENHETGAPAPRRLAATPGLSWVALIVSRLYAAQRARVAARNQIDGLIADKIIIEADAEELFKDAEKLEKQAEVEYERLVAVAIKNIPIAHDWMLKIYGVSTRITGMMLAHIKDIRHFPTVSSLWAYAGMHVKLQCAGCGVPVANLTPTEDRHGMCFVCDKCGCTETIGKAPRLERGVKATWNNQLRTAGYRFFDCVTKGGGPYQELMNAYSNRIVAREVAKRSVIYTKQPGGKWVIAHANKRLMAAPPPTPTSRPEWTLKRIQLMRMRWVFKLFLSHTWQVWRELEGLPVPRSFVFEQLGHEHFIDPWSMVKEPCGESRNTRENHG